VGIFAEGKTHALAVGKTAMSTKDIKEKNKGVGVENYHYLNDGLWNMSKVKQ
jgi:PUA domain protein